MQKKKIIPYGEKGMGPLERGRFRYQQKDYSGALEAFTVAIDMSSDHLLLDALNHRVAAYEKLHQLQPALRDAKRMIELKPCLSKGYLRCAKVLQLKGENKLALKIYERGLEKVKIGADNERTLLQSAYTKLRHAQDPGKTRDPLQYLPLELAVIVCQYLDTRDQVVCLCVSKSWKRLLESSHSLWTTLDTTHIRKAISQKSLKIHLRRSNYTLDRAIITMKASFDAPRMVLLTKYCKNLRELQLRGLGMIGESLITALPYAQRLDTIRIGAESQISLSTVQSVFNICGKTLVDVSFLTIKGSRGESQADQWPKAESVKFLSLKADKESCLDIHGLRDATPNVTTVTINDWKIFHLHAAADLSTWTSLESLDLTNTQLGCLPKLPPTLRHLILSDNIFLNFSQDNDEEPTALPLLETFACDSTQFDASIIKIITAASIKAGNLKRLSLGRRLCQCLTPVEGEYPPSETLEELSLSFLIIGDQRAVQVASLYPKLRRLDVSGTKVTGVAVRQFVDMGITWLGLNECEQVGPDAVEWARGKGVEVSFNFPSRSANMRNARFRDLAF